MMETLDKHNVKATFFMTGGFVSDNPECVKTLVEKGHEPGNHSEHHYDMATITAGEMKTEIMDVHKKGQGADRKGYEGIQTAIRLVQQ